MLSACSGFGAVPSPTPEPTLTAAPTELPSPTLSPTPSGPTETPTPEPIDYAPMVAQVEDYLTYTADRYGYDLAIGFEDVTTGQQESINTEGRYHAMSSFKGPLAVMYLQMLEQGRITEKLHDREHIVQMLSVSANPDTSCLFERVGGIAAFNDWLAEEGFSRENNFVLKWQDWNCNEPGEYYVPKIDMRYTSGDEALGLPKGGVLLRCPIQQIPCDKAFAPVELAHFYARLARGELLNPQNTQQMYDWMVRKKDEAVFLNLLPEGAQATVYIKGGTQQATEQYRVNFFSEAGLVVTPQGTFALAIFMQRNPKWPGTEPMSRVAAIIYSYFTQAHGASAN
jgi:hypothetical protein